MDSFRSKVVDFVLQYEAKDVTEFWDMVNGWTFAADVADDWVAANQYESPKAEAEEWERVAHIVSTLKIDDIIADAGLGEME